MKTVWIAVCLLASSAAVAEEKTTYTLNNLQMEMTVCAAYYSQMKACIGAQNESLNVSTQKTVDLPTKQLFNVGKNIGVSQDAMLSRLQMAQDEQTKLLKGDCINIASLFARHADRCKLVVENANAVLKEYMSK
jgi:hypothetical protein